MSGSGTKPRGVDMNSKRQVGAKNAPSSAGGVGDLGLGLVGTSAPAGNSRSLNSAGNGINVRPVPVATRNLKQEFTFAQPPTASSSASSSANINVPQSQIMSAVVLPYSHSAAQGQQPLPRSSGTPDTHSRGPTSSSSSSSVVSLAVNQVATPLTVAAPTHALRSNNATVGSSGAPIPRPPVEEKVTPTKPLRRSFGSEGGVSPQGARTSPSSVGMEREERGPGTSMMSSCACGDDEELPPLSEDTRMSDAVMNQYNGGTKAYQPKKVVVTSPKKDTGKAPPKGVGGALWGPPIDEPTSYEEEQREERMPPHGSIVRRLSPEEVAERNRRTVNAARSANTHVNPPPASTNQLQSTRLGSMASQQASASTNSGVGTGMDRRVASPGTEKKGLLISADFRRSLAAAATLVEKHASGIAPPLYFQHLNQEILRRIQAEQSQS